MFHRIEIAPAAVSRISVDMERARPPLPPPGAAADEAGAACAPRRGDAIGAGGKTTESWRTRDFGAGDVGWLVVAVFMALVADSGTAEVESEFEAVSVCRRKSTALSSTSTRTAGSMSDVATVMASLGAGTDATAGAALEATEMVSAAVDDEVATAVVEATVVDDVVVVVVSVSVTGTAAAAVAADVVAPLPFLPLAT